MKLHVILATQKEGVDIKVRDSLVSKIKGFDEKIKIHISNVRIDFLSAFLQKQTLSDDEKVKVVVYTNVPFSMITEAKKTIDKQPVPFPIYYVRIGSMIQVDGVDESIGAVEKWKAGKLMNSNFIHS